MKVITKQFVPGKYRGSKTVNGRLYYLVEWSRFGDACNLNTQWLPATACKLESELPKWLRKIPIVKKFRKWNKNRVDQKAKRRKIA